MIQYKDWDSNILKIKVGEVTPPLSIYDKINDYDYLYSRINIEDLNSIRYLEVLRFRTIEVFFDFVRGSELRNESINNKIRLATVEDLPDLHKISDDSFYLSRYHLDPAIDPDLANDLYRTWITNAVNKNFGDATFVYENNGDILGFIICRLKKVGHIPVGVIDLTATVQNMFNGNIGSSLIDKAIMFFNFSGCKYITTGTQAINTASIGLLKRCGFDHHNTYITLSRDMRYE